MMKFSALLRGLICTIFLMALVLSSAQASPWKDKLKKKLGKSDDVEVVEESPRESKAPPMPSQTVLTTDHYCRYSPDSTPFFSVKNLNLALSVDDFYSLGYKNGGRFEGIPENDGRVNVAGYSLRDPVREGKYLTTGDSVVRMNDRGSYLRTTAFKFDGRYTVAGLPVEKAVYETIDSYKLKGGRLEHKCDTIITTVVSLNTKAEVCKLRDAFMQKYAHLKPNRDIDTSCEDEWKGKQGSHTETLSLRPSTGETRESAFYTATIRLKLNHTYYTEPQYSQGLDVGDL